MIDRDLGQHREPAAAFTALAFAQAAIEVSAQQRLRQGQAASQAAADLGSGTFCRSGSIGLSLYSAWSRTVTVTAAALALHRRSADLRIERISHSSQESLLVTLSRAASRAAARRRSIASFCCRSSLLTCLFVTPRRAAMPGLDPGIQTAPSALTIADCSFTRGWLGPYDLRRSPRTCWCGMSNRASWRTVSSSRDVKIMPSSSGSAASGSSPALRQRRLRRGAEHFHRRQAARERDQCSASCPGPESGSRRRPGTDGSAIVAGSVDFQDVLLHLGQLRLGLLLLLIEDVNYGRNSPVGYGFLVLRIGGDDGMSTMRTAFFGISRRQANRDGLIVGRLGRQASREPGRRSGGIADGSEPCRCKSEGSRAVATIGVLLMMRIAS